MNWMISICILAFTLLAGATAAAEPPKDSADTVSIPLDRIWANNIPGTRDIRELEPETSLNREDGRIVSEIRRVLGNTPGKGEKARPGFVVPCTGFDALRAAHAILVGKKPQPDTIDTNDQASLMFFSYQAGCYVELCSITRRTNRIEIRYRFVPHKTAFVSESLAVVPLGSLPPGEYSVSLCQLPLEIAQAVPDVADTLAKWGDQLVCNPFSFHVRAVDSN
jgi:hypothetical protein